MINKIKKMLKNLLTPQQAAGYSSQIFLSSTTSIFSLSKFAASCGVLNPNFETKYNKRAQEEIIGFVLIVVLISIVAVIFLSISLRKAPSVNHNELVGQFLPAMMRFNLDNPECAEGLRVKELVGKCAVGESCEGEDSCEILKINLAKILKDSWNIGSESKYSGVQISILKNGQGILEVKEGNCNAGKSGAEALIPVEAGERSEIVSVKMEVCAT